MTTTKQYLATLRRIPDDIVLAIGAQNFDESSNTRCVCGWAVRESIARELNISPESATIDRHNFSDSACASRMGGSEDEWYALWRGAADDTPNVERAFVDRLNEIVR